MTSRKRSGLKQTMHVTAKAGRCISACGQSVGMPDWMVQASPQGPCLLSRPVLGHHGIGRHHPRFRIRPCSAMCCLRQPPSFPMVSSERQRAKPVRRVAGASFLGAVEHTH